MAEGGWMKQKWEARANVQKELKRSQKRLKLEKQNKEGKQ